MTVTIFRDNDANAVFIVDANGVQFFNSLQAVLNSPTDVVIDVLDLARDLKVFAAVPFGEFVDDTATPYGATAADTVNALNIVFAAGGGGAAIPVITSATAINITFGDSINYELTATDGVGFEWNNLPAGVVNVEGNLRKIIGGESLAVGSYTPTATAVNLLGSDTETITITVASPPYANTKAIKFNNNDYMDATASTANPLYRASNGTGATDAWTIVGWFQGGTNGNKEQTILSFGGNNENSEGRVHLYWDASGGDKLLALEYGSKNNHLLLRTPDSSVVSGTYYQFIITYDGGTTGDDQNDLSDYYGRFEIWIDGASQTLQTSNSNDGFTGEIKDEVFRIGEAAWGGKHMRNNCLLDEVALWDTDETANVSAIYNSGTTHDLNLLTSAPDHYWRMGDGDTFPLIEDNTGSLDFTMFNMTAADIVNDVP